MTIILYETRHTHVDSQLAEIRVKLTGEAQASGDTRHDNRNEVVQVAVGWCRELQCPEANIVQRFVVDTEGLVGVLNELVNRKGRVVRLSGVVFS